MLVLWAATLIQRMPTGIRLSSARCVRASGINAGADQRERWMIMLLRRLDNGDNLPAALEDCCDGSIAGSASTDNKYLMVCEPCVMPTFI